MEGAFDKEESLIKTYNFSKFAWSVYQRGAFESDGALIEENTIGHGGTRKETKTYRETNKQAKKHRDKQGNKET